MGGVQIRRGVSHTPVEEVEIGVVGAGHPGGAAAEAPTVTGPGFRALLAWRRDGVEAPSQAAGAGIESSEIAAVGGVPAGDAGNHHVFHHQGCAGDVAAALPRVLDVDAPQLSARLLVERHHVIVGGAHEHAPIADGNARFCRP